MPDRDAERLVASLEQRLHQYERLLAKASAADAGEDADPVWADVEKALRFEPKD
jgi:hypothetical protein